MSENIPKRKTVKYIDPRLVKKTALIHSFLGAFIIIFSGVVLYSLPAKIFYIVFTVGNYFFFSGIFITFSIVSERSARKLAKFLIVYWLVKPRR